jgi:hypothetical protein
LIPIKKWRNYYPIIIFSALLGTISDLLGVVLDQWVYYGPVVGALSLWSDLGIAPAEGGLFIRFFPIERTRTIQILYWGSWAFANASLEWFFVWVGWIGYNRWNPLKAFIFYLLFFGLIWIQEYWYNGTGNFN